MLVAVTLVLSLILAAALTVCAMYFKTVSNGLIHLFSVIYSIPSLAMFAMLIPVTGLGTKTALIVLTLITSTCFCAILRQGSTESIPLSLKRPRGWG